MDMSALTPAEAASLRAYLADTARKSPLGQVQSSQATSESLPSGQTSRSITNILEDPSRYQVNKNSKPYEIAASAAPEIINSVSSPLSFSLSPGNLSLLKTGAGIAASQAGVDPTVSKFIAPAISLFGGDTQGALRQGASTLSGVGLKAASVPAPLIGPLATLATGYLMDDSKSKLYESTANSTLGALVSALGGPVGSAVYTVARTLGMNPAQLLGENIGMYPDLTKGYEGGLWGKQGLGSGATPVSDQYYSPATSLGNDPYSQAPAPVDDRSAGVVNTSYVPADFSNLGATPSLNIGINSTAAPGLVRQGDEAGRSLSSSQTEFSGPSESNPYYSYNNYAKGGLVRLARRYDCSK